jgi:bifunctional UDP-N-acetylglucosamine pyrophosphorylase / glucosamine-1-phosphate N-acetyltransferase
MDNSSHSDLNVLILAAGLGTRMRSSRAKVLHALDGRPLINHVCEAAIGLGPRKIYVVVGHQGEMVQEAVRAGVGEDIAEFAWQTEQLGTGHAVNSARTFLENENSTLLVLSGDVPMLRTDTLARLIDAHRSENAACTLLTVNLEDPTGYGRISRDGNGNFEGIVEQKDASAEERQITEINAGIYCFNTEMLFDALSKVGNQNAQGEYYLTDVPGLLKGNGETVKLFHHNDNAEVSGINNRQELAEKETALRQRKIRSLQLDHGVTFIDERNVFISSEAVIGRDTVIYPNVHIEGASSLGEGCTVRQGTRITNSVIGNNAEVLDHCVIVDSVVGEGCAVGPFAHLRAGAQMGESSRVGNFVELKKTILGTGAKSMHLSYLGDATIGEKTNIGAGTITCNYDGKNKHKTNIGSGVKIGSDTMLIAPVSVGDGAVTGAGSVITKDVPENTVVAGVPARVIRKADK